MKTSYTLLSIFVFTVMSTGCQKKMVFTPADMIDGIDTSEATEGGEGDDGTGGTSTPPSCTVTYDEIQTPVKVLFLIDKSGSNLDDSNTATLNDGTDPNKTWRTTSINNLRSGLDPALFSFNLTLFRGNQNNINDGNRYGGAGGSLTLSLMSGFSNNTTVFNNAMSSFAADPDKGKTPYEAALTKARDIIAADIANDSVSNYSVIMVTDGHPDPNLATKTDCIDHICNTSNGADADIPKSIEIARAFVKEIVDINRNRVNVNTVYYYSTTRRITPITILKNMADEGRGAFIEANSNQTLDFKNVVRVPTGTSCP